MPTVGSTSEPTTAAEGWGLNSKNYFAQKITMPGGGPWIITKIAAWLRGWDETVSVKLAIWGDGENLLDTAAAQDVSGAALSTTAGILVDGTVNVEVNGGAVVWVGFIRDPDENVQISTRSSGSHREKIGSYSSPGGLGGFDTHSIGDMGAYVADYESANVAPNAPTNLSPSGSEVVNQGGSTVLSGTRSDPDSGDYISEYQYVIYEDDGSTVVSNPGPFNPTGTPTTFSKTTSTVIPNGNFYKWKARTKDKGGLWGPYSSLQRFRPNTPPNAPTNLQVETDTLTPLFSGSFSDDDPGSSVIGQIESIQIQVELNASPHTLKWDSGWIAKTDEQWNQTYAGSALAFGTAYRWRARTADGVSAVGPYSAWQTFTPVAPPGPDNLTPRTLTTKQQTLTPTLTVGHLGYQFRNERIQVYAANSLSSTLLWDKAKEGADYALTNSVGRVYAGTALAWGGTYYWRALIENGSGVDSSWSNLVPFYINAAPSSPSGMSPTGGAPTTDTTPNLVSTYEDPDKGTYGDTPNRLEWEIYNNATGALVTSGSVTNPTVPATVVPGALTNETTYKWRARYRDQASQFGPWSGYHVFKVTSAPTAANVGPASPVLESTPTLDWSFTSPGGKAQSSYRLEVFDKGPTGANYAEEQPVYDSGTILSTATAQDLPQGVLLDDHDYRWQVTVTDTDGLSHTLT